MKLNLGCGLELLDGYINIDARPLPGVIVADITKLDIIPGGSCTEILASHVLEHLAETVVVLDHWRSKLTPDGTLIVRVPDLEGCMRQFLKASHLERYKMPGHIRGIYGDTWHPYNNHLTGFTEERLVEVLGEAHFRSVRVSRGFAKGAPELEVKACFKRPSR